jgi:hypothetical protein
VEEARFKQDINGVVQFETVEDEQKTEVWDQIELEKVMGGYGAVWREP